MAQHEVLVGPGDVPTRIFALLRTPSADQRFPPARPLPPPAPRPGAPNVVLDMCQNGASIKKHFEEEVNAFADRGIRCLAVAKSNAQGLQMLGVLTFLDPPRHDTKWTIDRSYEYGVGVKMITGDHKVALIRLSSSRSMAIQTRQRATSGVPKGNRAEPSCVLGQ